MSDATSLKSLILWMADQLRMPPAAFYERQRALVRAGMLKAEPGRGPGSGVRATADLVALLLIGILAGGELSETAATTSKVANLRCNQTRKPEEEGWKAADRCAITGKKTFGKALAAVLASDELAEGVCIHVDFSHSSYLHPFLAGIDRRNKDGWTMTSFGSPGLVHLNKPRLHRRAILNFPYTEIGHLIRGAKK